MHLIIFANSPPPGKAIWADPDQKSRGEWSEIYEAVTTWFCYSNGLRKELNLDIVIDTKTIRIYGDRVKYLAPSLRSAASIIWQAFYKKQPGVELIQTPTLQEYVKPFYTLSEYDSSSSSSSINVMDIGTLFLNPSISFIDKLNENGGTKIPVMGRFNSQKLVWLLYND